MTAKPECIAEEQTPPRRHLVCTRARVDVRYESGSNECAREVLLPRLALLPLPPLPLPPPSLLLLPMLLLFLLMLMLLRASRLVGCSM